METAQRNEYILDNMDLIKIHSGRAKLMYPFIEFEDFKDFFLDVLIQAVETYSGKAPFRNYANFAMRKKLPDYFRLRFGRTNRRYAEFYPLSVSLQSSSDLEREVMNDELNANLNMEINRLPSNERFVILNYYGFENEMTMDEIGKSLGVTYSRVSQINSKAVKRLRKRLR